MATDVVLLRLREVLQTASTHCDAALQAIGSILESSSEQKTVRQWSNENGRASKAAVENSSAAKRAVVNAETLCDRLGLNGDAGYLRHAGNELARCFLEFRTIYRSAIKTKP